MWQTGHQWLQYDGAPAYHSNIVTRYLHATQTHVLPHLAYSPDVAPCNYWLFSCVKCHLKGQRFQDIHKLRHILDNVLRAIPREQFECALNKLVSHWQACIQANGDYFE